MATNLFQSSFRRMVGGLTTLGLVAATAATLHAAEPLNDADAKFMTLYEQVLKALVTENLEGVKQAANAIPGGGGGEVAKAKDLKAARDAFAVLSSRAEKIVAGQPGFYVFNCPMVNRDWVQRTNKPANPYMGKEMLTCAVEKKL